MFWMLDLIGYRALAALGSHPVVILADTIKGKGVSFMENDISWHSGIPSKDEYKRKLIN